MSSYLAAVLFLGTATLAGQAVLCLAGARSWSWLAPAVGLATLIVIETIAIQLPGRATTAVALTLALLAAAAFTLARRLEWTVPWRAGVVCVPPLIASALPFLAVNRVGLLGPGFDNDMASHLIWAQALLSPHIEALYPLPAGYPLGPHSLVATLAGASGLRVDHVFVGLLIVVLLITALTAAAAFAKMALWRRTLLALVVAVSYLAAAFYSEGAFKEPLLAMLLLGFVVYVRGVARDHAHIRSTIAWLRACIPPALFIAAAIDVYSDVAIGWFGVFVVVWVLGELLARPGLLRAPAIHWRQLRRGALIAVGAGMLVLVALAPTLGRIITYAQELGTSPSATGAISKTSLGNLAGPLPPLEGLGIWFQPDFRFLPSNLFNAGVFETAALAALVFGVLWSLRRRDIALPALAVACGLIYWYTNRTQSPYIAAKALVIASPSVMLLSARGLLAGREEDRGPRRRTALRTLCGLAFALAALLSSALVLRAAHVMPAEPVNELGALRPLVGSAPTLFLGNDDFVGWELRGVDLGYLDDAATLGPPHPATLSYTYVYGQPLEFDSIPAAELDQYRYVITTSGAYATAPPSNFHLIRTQRLYELWERRGPTPAGTVPASPGAPGTMVDCKSAAGRAIAHTAGVAASAAPPVSAGSLPYLLAGGFATTTVALPKGTWNISLDYSSSETLEITIGGAHFTMPANLARPGPLYELGTVRSPGGAPLPVGVYEDHPSRFASSEDIGDVTALVATRDPNPLTLIPLGQSCGRYIEWYRPAT